MKQKLHTMQKTIIAIALLLTSLSVSAQIERRNTLDAKVEDASENIDTPTIEPAQLSAEIIDVENVANYYMGDSIRISKPNLPLYLTRPYLFSLWMPTSPLLWGTPLDLHDGFNAQIGLGVIAGFGKNNPFKGASFYTDITLAYAKQLDDHWSVALGGTLSRFKMWNENVWSGNLFAVGNYKFNEHWSASIYGSYNHIPEGMGYMGMYGPMNWARLNENCARIGGEVTYKFNENFAVSIGASTDIYTDNPRPWKPHHPTQQHLTTPHVR